MPRRKPKPEKVIEERIKQNLDSILMDEGFDVSFAADSVDLPRIKTTDLMDFAGAQTSAASDAKTLMDSLAEFYVDLSTENASALHVQHKKKMDTMNVSAMMFQLKTAQHTITKILEEIDLGNTNPRLFEVLAQMQSQIMQMPKDYQAYLEKMEQNYKKSRIEIDEKKQTNRVIMDQNGSGESYGAPVSAMTDNGGIKSRGTRGIMEGLRDIIGSEVVDITAEVVEPNAVVNAKHKKIFDLDNPNISKSDNNIDDEDGFIIEDDLY
jgi:hypothetical protein